MTDRTIIVPSLYIGQADAELTLESRDGETGDMELVLGGETLARGEGFRAAQVGPSLLELSDGRLAGMFGAFLEHALESSEDDAREGWPILEEAASDWTDALSLMEEGGE